MSNYWLSRQEKAQKARADKTIEDIERQLKKYYSGAMKRTIADFEATYNKIVNAVEDGKEPTPADLYKLDQYWKMQAQLKNEMQKLGDKEVALLSKEFEDEWRDIYNNTHLPSDKAFSTISVDNAKAMINAAWLADGKTFSQRVWNNTEKLVDTLNEQLVHCVITGKKPTELKRLLQERFNVSYHSAETLVRTEVAHIETAAAAQRYKDYGLEKYEFLGRDEHDIGCACKKLNGKQFLYGEMQIGKNAPPLHPNCRCAIIPVIDESIMEDKSMDNNFDAKHGLNMSRDEREKRIRKEFSYLFEQDVKDIMSEKRKTYQKRLDKADKKGHYGRFSLEFDRYMDYLEREKEVEKEVRDELISHYTFCIDCGKALYHPKGQALNAIKRCPDCQEIYRRKYKAEKEKERRKRKKANTN